MNDRQLLTMAAKAAGIPLKPDFAKRYEYYMADKLMWSPLTDDGDALRLAVRLNLDVCPGEVKAGVTWWVRPDMIEMDGVSELHGGDPCAATRRAIVRAAAAIGAQT